MIRSTLSTFTKHTMGRVRRRTSTKQRSITLVVRSLRHAQPDRAQPGREIPLVVAVAVGLPPAAPPRTGFPHRIAVPLPPRFLFQQTLPAWSRRTHPRRNFPSSPPKNVGNARGLGLSSP